MKLVVAFTIYFMELKYRELQFLINTRFANYFYLKQFRSKFPLLGLKFNGEFPLFL